MGFAIAFELKKGVSGMTRERKAAGATASIWTALSAILCLFLTACGGTRLPSVSVRPISLLALRYEATVPQQFDYTCGAASVATVLTYYWDQRTTEAQVVDTLKRRYSLKEIAERRETGLSFDDLIFAAARLGFEAQGAQIAISELTKLKGPAIIQLTNSKFQHFVVLRQVGAKVYYVSDPIVGQLAMSEAEFNRDFSGFALAIWRSPASLPSNTKLMRPRDGLSVTNSLEKAINAGVWYPHPVL